jgi:hypothetical protein
MNFIRLSNMVINASKISTIVMEKNKFNIYLLHTDIYNRGAWVGPPTIHLNHMYVEICKKKQPCDYLVMERWLSENTR